MDACQHLRSAHHKLAWFAGNALGQLETILQQVQEETGCR